MLRRFKVITQGNIFQSHLRFLTHVSPVLPVHCSLIPSLISFKADKVLFYGMTYVCNYQRYYKDRRGGAVYLGLILLGQSLDGFLLLGLEGLFTALVCFFDVRPVGLSRSSRSFLRALSAFSLWMHSMRTHLLLNTLPFIFMYRL